MRRIAALGLLLPLAAATAALAQPPEMGQPVPESVRVAPVSDPDPDGGPPWSMRLFRTTGGFECSQIGRVADGKLGTVDESGAFQESPVRPGGCGGPAPAGREPRSHGYGLQVTNAPKEGCELPRDPRNRLPECSARQMRTVYYGIFGPRLKRVLFANADWSGRRYVQVSGNGEWVATVRGLVNDFTQPRIRLYFDGGCGPNRERLLDEWREARVQDCQIVATLDEPRPARESAASKRARRNPSRPMRVTVGPRTGHVHRRFTVRYKVPITVGPGDGYTYTLTGPATARGCTGARSRSASPDWFQNYADMIRGRTDEFLLSPGHKASWCRGTYRVSVSFVSRGKRYAPFGSATFVVR